MALSRQKELLCEEATIRVAHDFEELEDVSLALFEVEHARASKVEKLWVTLAFEKAFMQEI